MWFPVKTPKQITHFQVKLNNFVIFRTLKSLFQVKSFWRAVSYIFWGSHFRQTLADALMPILRISFSWKSQFLREYFVDMKISDSRRIIEIGASSYPGREREQLSLWLTCMASQYFNFENLIRVNFIQMSKIGRNYFWN